MSENGEEGSAHHSEQEVEHILRRRQSAVSTVPHAHRTRVAIPHNVLTIIVVEMQRIKVHG